LLVPAILLVVTLACFQQLGDALRDWLDVRDASNTPDGSAHEPASATIPATSA
jgi:hypothetical protein